MTHRRLLPTDEAFGSLTIAEGEGPIYRRMFVEAAIPLGGSDARKP